MRAYLTEKQKRLLKEFVDFQCEECRIHFDAKELLVHHLARQRGDGRLLAPEILHSLRNLKVICKGCSKKYHYKEFR
jgi:hypothetical protein